MSSTFGTLNTAFTGLTTARQAIGVAGQNIANVGTAGYTRQRAELSAASAPAATGLFTARISAPGQGVSVDGIARLGDAFADTRVRKASADAGYAGARAAALDSLETSLREPGDDGLSAELQTFWNSWQDLSNRTGEAAPTGVLLGNAAALAGRIASSYTETENLWNSTRAKLDSLVSELNDAAASVASLNAQVRSVLNSGGSANELVDRRNLLVEKIASLAGGSVRNNADGTADVYLGGNPLVNGDTARQVAVSGAHLLESSTGTQLEFTHRPGAIALNSGSLAGTLSVLAPADDSGTGGAIAQAASFYNSFALGLAAAVNAVHSTGLTPDGRTGLDFFGVTAGVPAARGLTVIPSGPSGVAAGAAGGGAFDGSTADRIAAISTAVDGPDKRWSGFVTGLGVTARADLQHASLAGLTLSSAVAAQSAGASVSLDEENVNLLASQHAYQAAARVMTAVDEMLDTLINRTGQVGR